MKKKAKKDVSISKVSVVARVRPLYERETEGFLSVSKNSVTVTSKPTQDKTFTFSNVLTKRPDVSDDALQAEVYANVGRPLLNYACQGYNTCLFAYGQTGSGKSYTVMGYEHSLGIVPRFCEELIQKVNEDKENTVFNVSVSYYEIYNEHVYDLLVEQGPTRASLKVREHPETGVFVEGLTRVPVHTKEEILGVIATGQCHRATAPTAFNEQSSRSHSVFTLYITQSIHCGEEIESRASQTNLIDLAGSERCGASKMTGERLKEGNNINKSLLNLGRVISVLSSHQDKDLSINPCVPYRDSKLTMLLRDSLGGNSRTIMIATLSPALEDYEHTISTLRYAQNAQKIVNVPTVNEDPNTRIIRDLRLEINTLKQEMSNSNIVSHGQLISKLQIDLENKQKHIAELKKLWEDKCAADENLNKCSTLKANHRVAHQLPCLVNLNEDPSLGEWLMFDLPLGKTLVGNSQNKDDLVDIPLGGFLIQKIHCAVENHDNTVTVKPWLNAAVYVNGGLLLTETTLSHGDRVIFGGNHFFRFSAPGHKSSNEIKLRKVVDYEFARDEMIEKLNQNYNRALQQELQGCRVREQECKDRLSQAEERIRQLSNQLKDVNTKQEGGRVETDHDFTFAKTNALLDEVLEKYNARLEKRKSSDIIPEITPSPLTLDHYQPLDRENFKIYMLLQEANKISEAMNKKIVFSHVIMELDGKAEVLVRLNNLDCNRSTTWNMERFQQKLQYMRDIYHGESSDSGMEDEGLFGSSEEVLWKKEYSFLSTTDLSSGYAHSEGSMSSLGNHSLLSNAGSVQEFENSVHFASLPSGALTIQSDLHSLITALSNPAPTSYYHCEMFLEAVRSLKTTTHRVMDAALSYLSQPASGKHCIPVAECSSIRKLIPRLSHHTAVLQIDVSHWSNHVATSDTYAPSASGLTSQLQDTVIECFKIITQLMQGVEKSNVPAIEEAHYSLAQCYDNMAYVAGQLCASCNTPHDKSLVNTSIQSTESADSKPSLPSDYGSNASNASNGEGLLVTFTEGVREHYLKCLEQSVSSVKQCALRETGKLGQSSEELSKIQTSTGELFTVLLDILSVTESAQKKTLLNKTTDTNLPMHYFVSQAVNFDKELLTKLEEISSGCRILSNSLNSPCGELEPIYHATCLLNNKLQTYLHCYNTTFIKSSSPKKQNIKKRPSVEKKNSFSSTDSFYSAKEEFQCELWFEEELGQMWAKYCAHTELICRTIKPNI